MEKKRYIAPGATIIGDVTLGDQVNIWYNAVLRGDRGAIVIGPCSNVQDNCVIHEKTTVGAWTSVGHGAILHGCTVGDDCIIGMGSVVLNGAVLGNGCLVGAGAVVTGKTVAPDGSVLLGNPAKIVKQMTPEQMEANRENARIYLELAFGK